MCRVLSLRNKTLPSSSVSKGWPRRPPLQPPLRRSAERALEGNEQHLPLSAGAREPLPGWALRMWDHRPLRAEVHIKGTVSGPGPCREKHHIPSLTGEIQSSFPNSNLLFLLPALFVAKTAIYLAPCLPRSPYQSSFLRVNWEATSQA